jgi:GNAT superfamily N-acetyltransferase
MEQYEERVEVGLIQRTVRSERDVERYAGFHFTFFGPREGTTCDYLMRQHPETCWDDFLFVEDEHSGEIVSTTCLIPWHVHYEGAVLKVAMMEMVGTHPDYRRRGLVRSLINRFHAAALERGYDLIVIHGIRYYYRQFGYTYALDLRPSSSLASWRIPPRREDQPLAYRLRPASLEDAPTLARLYQESRAGAQIYERRDAAYWRFLLQCAQYPVRVIEDQRDSRAAGYVCGKSLTDNRGVWVMDSAIASHDAAMAALQQLKAEGNSEILLGYPPAGTLAQVGRSLGAVPLPCNQWLVRIPDVVRLLSRLTPALERRLAVSACAGVTTDLILNLFRRAFRLRFGAGKLNEVQPLGFVDSSVGADGGDLLMPPDAFVRLVLGYRSLDELRDAWPDTGVKPEPRHLVEALFPRMTAALALPYEYCGATPAMS